MSVVVTADIVGSRQLPDRDEAQRVIEGAVARTAADLPVAARPPAATVGDEFQGEFHTLPDALAWLLLFQLALPDGLDCRFGVGVGPTTDVSSAVGPLAEGPAWWAARAAVDAVHARARAIPSARTEIVADAHENAAVHEQVRFARAYARARDELVAGMTGRARRLTRGRCLGATQRALARSEGITQSAVSQALNRSGAASVVAGYRLLRA